MDNLRKHWIILVDWGCICKKLEKQWITCYFTARLQAPALHNNFFGRVGLAWVMPKRVVDLLANWWRDLYGNLLVATMWKMVCICLPWCEIIGKSKIKNGPFDALTSLFISTLFLWAIVIGFNGLCCHDFLVPVSVSNP